MTVDVRRRSGARPVQDDELAAIISVLHAEGLVEGTLHEHAPTGTPWEATGRWRLAGRDYGPDAAGRARRRTPVSSRR